MDQNSFYKTTLDFVETTSRILKIASQLSSRQDKIEKSVQNKVASVAALLHSAELIDSHEVKSAEAQLTNPAETLAILSNVIEHYSEKLKTANSKLAAATMGTATNSKKASSSRNYSEKRSGEVSEADKALLRLLDK